MRRENFAGLTVAFAITAKFVSVLAVALGRVSVLARRAFALAVPAGLAFLAPPGIYAPGFVIQDDL